MKHLLYLILLSALLAGCSSVEKSLRRGDNALAIGEYAEAAGQYRKAYQRTPSKERDKRGEISYRMGEAYRRYGNVARALAAFRTAERYGHTDTLTLLRLGDMQRYMGDYAGAEASYGKYLDAHPGDEAAILAAEMCRDAIEAKGRQSAYTVRPANLFNSSRSDYCPALHGDDGAQLYFTSTRRTATGDLSGITAMKPGDLYVARQDQNGKWKVPEAVEGVNTALDEGACAFSADGETMYLTVCPVDAQYPRMAQIWTSKRSDAKWSKPTALKITADSLSSYAHPAPSPDGGWLYFTSDMPGGYGGLDIWRVQLDSHGTGIVENLGPDVNTAGNECFPAWRPTGEFYFSSDGRMPNFGGLDLYRAVEDSVTRHWSVSHLPAPMNSQADDFGITFEGTRHRGYFSSSRSTGGRGWDKLYEFSHPEQLQTVKGWVYEQDGYELPAAQVYMVGSDGSYEKLSVQSDGSFERPVIAGVHYLFMAACPGYLNIREQLDPDEVETEHQHVLQFPLPSMNIPVLLRGIYYEFDKAVLTDSSRVALDRLVTLLKENPNVTIELSAHCDQRGSDAYNLRLSQQRAESVVSYLTEHGIEPQRLAAKGYGKNRPKTITKKLAEAYPFFHAGDTLTTAYIAKLPAERREIAFALNRRTEFRVTSTTYGLFDEHGALRPDALKPKKKAGGDDEAEADGPVAAEGEENWY